MSEPIIKNGKGSLGVDNVASINAKRTIAISSTASEKDNEPVNKELSWAKLADFYSRPMVGDKGGKAMMPFTMNGIRAIERAIQSDLLSIDVDCGAPFDDVVASATKLGFECFIHTTFSNMKETTEISAKRVEVVGVVECLAAKYLPAIYLNEQTGESICEVVGEVERTRTTTVQGKRVTTTSSYNVVHHNPVPKMRLVFLLAKPFVVKHYGPAAENTWREMYHAMAEQLGVKADGSAADLARLFFTPRVPDKAAVEHFQFAYLPGKPVRVSDLIDPEAMKSIDARQHGPTTTAIIQERIAQRVVYEPSGSIHNDVKRWLGINKPDLRGVIMGADSAWPILKTDATKLHLQCPFMDDHSNEQLEGDTSFSLLSEGALHCYHDGCNGRERLDFLSRAFELGWLDTGLLAVDTSIASADVERELDVITDTGGSVPQVAVKPLPLKLEDRYYLVDSDNRWFDSVTKVTMTQAALNTTWAKEHNRHNGGEATTKLKKSGSLKIVNHLGWMPTEATVFHHGAKSYANIYEGFPIAPIKGDVSIWLDLVQYIYGNYWELFVDSCAYNIQNPASKVRWQILVLGTPRTGKTLTIKPLEHIWGSACRVVGADDVATGWGDYYVGTKVLVIEEVYQPGNKSFFNNLKSKLVNSNMESLNPKGRGLVVQQNLYQMVLFTNHPEALHFNANEDKLLIIESPDTPWADGKRFGEYADAVDGEDGSQLTNHIYHYLLNKDVSKFSYGCLPVRTAAMYEMAKAGKPDYHRAIIDAAESREPPFIGEYVTVDEVRKFLGGARYGKYGDNGISEALKESGMVRIRGARKVGRTSKATPAVWVLADHVMANAGAGDVYDWYQKVKKSPADAFLPLDPPF